MAELQFILEQLSGLRLSRSREALSNEHAIFPGQLAAAMAELPALQKKIASLSAELDAYRSEFDKSRIASAAIAAKEKALW